MTPTAERRRRSRRWSRARPCCRVLNGVSRGKIEARRGRHRRARRRKAGRRHALRRRLDPRGRRRRGRRAQHGLRRRRLVRRHRGRARRSRRRSSCRTSRPAARPMCACRCGSARAPRRRSSSARPATGAALVSRRSAISLVGDGAEVRWLIVQDQPDDGDLSRPVQRRARQGRQADAVRHERRRQAGAPGSPRRRRRARAPTSRCAASTCWRRHAIPT